MRSNTRSAWLVAVSAFALHAQAAAQPAEQGCVAAGERVVAVGVPERYRGRYQGGRLGAACVVVAHGNDYQLFDWLENGRLDAALLSPFAAGLLAREGADAWRALRYWPLDGQPLPAYSSGLAGADVTDPRAALLDDARPVRLDSHLSPLLPALLRFIERELVAGGDGDERAAAWERQLARLNFGGKVAAGDLVETRVAVDGSPGAAFVPPGGAAQQDVLVYQRQFDPLFGTPGRSAGGSLLLAAPGSGVFDRWLRAENPELAELERGLSGFLARNYSLHEAGFRKHRHFRFRLDELWAHLVARERQVDPFALVLTGGGVKSAYQTRLVEYLYDGGYLGNAGAAPANGSPRHATIPVDYVVGTSGGALLGTLVTRIDRPAGPSLTRTVWTRCAPGDACDDARDYVGNADIFPFIEMPRYLALVVSGVLFLALVLVVRAVGPLRRRTEPTTLPAALLQLETARPWFPPRMIWVLLLIIAPWLIKDVNGVLGLEHVPAVTGLFYFLCVIVALYSDNRLIFDDRFRWEQVSFRGANLVLLVLAILLTLSPWVVETMRDGGDVSISDGFGSVSWATLVCCVGLLLLFLSWHHALANAADPAVRVRVGARYLLSATAMILLAPLLAHLALWLSGTTLFELTPGFWLAFMACSATVTALLILLAHLPPSGSPRNPLKPGWDLLVAPFPKSTWFLDLRRYQRVILFLVASFFYWNAVMAPAIYGNERAIDYFKTTYARWHCASAGIPESDCNLDLDARIDDPLHTTFVVSATSLARQRERYFVFDPARLGESPTGGGCAPADGTSPLAALAQRDPRWQLADCRLSHQALIDVVFASGSPFPVFPATRVELPGHSQEWLVDGGYAHNVPIQAAHILGAERVLVISSSPLHEHDLRPAALIEAERERSLEATFRLGNLGDNAARLFPYLFERSQIEDATSAEDILVATLSPSPAAAAGGWPLLTDFQGQVVRRLVEAAEADLDQRIGLVESWGPPDCEFAGARLDCAALKHAAGGH